MIRVTKRTCPDALLAGADRTRKDCAAYSNGKRQFDFAPAIYGHKAVKMALQEAQHGKCCYCEGRFYAFAAPDVEHHRPKGAVRQDRESKNLSPGYYWLAYSWENLYLCCQVCNRSCKKDLFPLEDPAARARSHQDDISGEKPLLLDPGGPDDPRKHIQFRQEHAVGLTEAGQATIEVLDLNREALVDERLERLKALRRLQDTIQLLADSTEPNHVDLREDARNELARANLPDAIFSAMAADLLLENQAGADAP